MDELEQLQIELLAHAVAIARHHAGLATGFTDVQKVLGVLGVTEPFNEDDVRAVWAGMVALSKADSNVVFSVQRMMSDMIMRNELLDQIEPQLQKISALELKLAQLTGAIDILRGMQPPPPAKFPTIRAWKEDTIHHEGDIVIFAGGTYQAQRDTARAPGTKDWVCLATPGNSLTMRGTYGNAEYHYLDVVALNGSSFVALKDNPGPCPDSGDWQLLASRGSRGHRGDSGARGIMGLRGERGAAAPTIKSWEVDRASYAATPVMSDGSKGPPLELHALFEQFVSERGE